MTRRQRLNLCIGVFLLFGCVSHTSAQTLEGYAVLPADTFEPGPTSGQFITPANGRIPPFANKQPVQGISAVLRASNADFLVMSDNGFGAQNNSQDALLRVHRISPDFKTKTKGTGSVQVKSFITLSDPNHRINFPIVADNTNYPFTNLTIPVDPSIRQNRLLTGADFDIESVRESHTGRCGSATNSVPLPFTPMRRVWSGHAVSPARSEFSAKSIPWNAKFAGKQRFRRYGDYAGRQTAISTTGRSADDGSGPASPHHQ